MPILNNKLYVPEKRNIPPEKTNFTIKFTGEPFETKSSYDKQLKFYSSKMWCCQGTGATNLSYKDALESEKMTREMIDEQFPEHWYKTVLSVAHHCTKSIDNIVDEAYRELLSEFVLDDSVILKKQPGLEGVIIKVVKPEGYKSTAKSASTPTASTSADQSTKSPLKTPPDLKPFLYSIRVVKNTTANIKAALVNNVPALELTRIGVQPSKKMIKLCIRSHCHRLNYGTIGSPCIASPAIVRKYELPSKLANIFLTTPKTKKPEATPEKSAKADKEKPKPDKEKAKPDTEKSKEKAEKVVKKIGQGKKPIAAPKLKSKPAGKDETAKAKPKNEKEKPKLKGEDSIKKMKDPKPVPPKKPKIDLTPTLIYNVTPDPDDQTKDVETVKIMVKSPMKQMERQKMNRFKSMIDKIKKDDSILEDRENEMINLAEKDVKKRKLDEEAADSGTEGKTATKKLKQLSLFELSRDKKSVTVKIDAPLSNTALLLSPRQKARRNFDLMCTRLEREYNASCKDPNNAKLRGKYQSMIGLATQKLTPDQMGDLPNELIRDACLKRYERNSERDKLARMTEEEKAYYLKQKMKERQEHRRQHDRVVKQRFEDQEIKNAADLPKPLPVSFRLPSEAEFPVELFADVAMVVEFFHCFKGLLTPSEESGEKPVKRTGPKENFVVAELLIKALVGNTTEDKIYLSRVLVALLQTLLQDSSEDYMRELSVNLREVSVNIYNASEILRLCMRKRGTLDNSTEKTDNDNDNVSVHSELSEDSIFLEDDILEELGSVEYDGLAPPKKVSVLVVLVQRILNGNSLWDYQELKSDELSGMWKERNIFFIERKKQQEMSKNDEKESSKTGVATPSASNVSEKTEISASDSSAAHGDQPTLFESFGKKEKPSTSELDVLLDVDESELDLALVVKRRRLLAAQEKKRKEEQEVLDKERRKREAEEAVKQREIDARIRERAEIDKKFVDVQKECKRILRWEPIGLDRDHSRYWMFGKSVPGLFVEKGWFPQDLLTYSTKPPAQIAGETPKKVAEEDVEEFKSTPTPHSNSWYHYKTVEDFDLLLQVLLSQGLRESHLKTELTKQAEDIKKSIERAQNPTACDELVANISREIGIFDAIESLKTELTQMEVQLRDGALGGVADFADWSTRLTTAVDLPAVAQCIIECYQNVQPQFLKGMMSIKLAVTSDDPDTETSQDEDELCRQDELIRRTNKIQDWIDSLTSCKTWSRMTFLLGIFEACVRWERSVAKMACRVCRMKHQEAQTLLCDTCNAPFHMRCLRPPLTRVPRGKWFCPACKPSSPRRDTRHKRYKEAESSDEDSSEDEESDVPPEIEHDETCAQCDGLGDNFDSLVECCTCEYVFHLGCHIPPLRHAPRGSWSCSRCQSGCQYGKRKSTKRGRPKAPSRARSPVANASRKKKPLVNRDLFDDEATSADDVDSGCDIRKSRSAAKRSADSSRLRRCVTRPNYNDAKQSSADDEDNNDNEDSENTPYNTEADTADTSDVDEERVERRSLRSSRSRGSDIESEQEETPVPKASKRELEAVLRRITQHRLAHPLMSLPDQNENVHRPHRQATQQSTGLDLSQLKSQIGSYSAVSDLLDDVREVIQNGRIIFKNNIRRLESLAEFESDVDQMALEYN